MFDLSKLLAVALFISPAALAREFTGDLVLEPEGCAENGLKICKLGAVLQYRSSRNGWAWQTDRWTNGNGQSGTTDGASIPTWAQPIIGKSFDPSYLKAAIIHDHYYYEENHVRSWRQTHLMFHDALLDLGIDEIKAKTMYFAVFLAGPKWIDLVAGENCGELCLKSITVNPVPPDSDSFGNNAHQASIRDIQAQLQAGADLSLADLETEALRIKPDDFFYLNGSTYPPSGSDDSQARSRL